MSERTPEIATNEPAAQTQPQAQGLSFTIDGAPSYSLARLQLPEGKTVRVEASAMASQDTNIKMRSKAKGGVKRFLARESLFVNEFTSEHGAGELCIAPGSPGDISHRYLQNETIYIQGGGYLASAGEIQCDTKFQGLKKGLFSGESFFLIKCSGTGDLWFNSYGGIIKLDNVDKEFVVDTGHIVAFTEGLEYDVTKLGGYKSLFFSGEGFVCRFRGSGTLWLQTRTMSQFIPWVWRYRPSKKN